ncbi:MAG TPA: hypothetical protein VGW78_01725 [Candidatus Babeliales bacterium]|jgi:hypothetical protein|nr:hypothetical protein [Candidatus Babeliales bacterium]
MMIVYGALLLVSGLQAMNNQEQKPFDALLYMQLMPQEIHEKIKSYCYHQNPVQVQKKLLQKKLYTSKQYNKDYPWAFNENGVLTVHDAHNNKQISAKLIDHKYFSFGISYVRIISYDDSDVVHSVRLCGPDNTNSLCFVDNEIWVIPTGRRYVLSGYYSIDNYKTTYLCVEPIRPDEIIRNKDINFIPCALASDGSRCIISRLLNEELWLCDIIMPQDKTTMDFFPGNIEKNANASYIKKICSLGKPHNTIKVCMPSPDSAVIHFEDENIIECIRYKPGEELSKYIVDIPKGYYPRSIYAIDYMPNKFVVKITNKGRWLNECFIGVYSIDQTVPPVFLFVDADNWQGLTPNRSTRQIIILNDCARRNLCLHARSPEEWDAWILLYAAQQLHKKKQWTAQDQASAHTLLNRMYTWHDEMNGVIARPDTNKDYRPINPYYFYWLAKTSDGNSNYFRDVYYRMHPEKVKPIIPHNINPFNTSVCIVQ